MNIVTAKELFSYPHHLILILGRTHSSKIAHVDSFRQGLVQRIGERLAEQNRPEVGSDQEFSSGNEEKALILRADAAANVENHAFIKQKNGRTTTRRTGRRVEADSYYHGRAVGDTVNLDKQIEG